MMISGSVHPIQRNDMNSLSPSPLQAACKSPSRGGPAWPSARFFGGGHASCRTQGGMGVAISWSDVMSFVSPNRFLEEVQLP